MPRGRRKNGTLVTLVNELTALDARRVVLVQRIQAAAGALETGRATGASAGRKGGRRKGFTLSAEARHKISLAQKKRWAKQKAGK